MWCDFYIFHPRIFTLAVYTDFYVITPLYNDRYITILSEMDHLSSSQCST